MAEPFDDVPVTPPTPPLWKREPVAVLGSLQGVVAAVISLLVAFNAWDPTSSQITALSGLWAAVTAVAVMFIRGQVTPDVNVALTNKDVVAIREFQATEE